MEGVAGHEAQMLALVGGGSKLVNQGGDARCTGGDIARCGARRFGNTPLPERRRALWLK